MPGNTFDLTPDPKVLIALTQTPLQPLDALCELIDNALDSFDAAKLQGMPVEYPLVTVELPSVSECNNGTGILRVRDNGLGLSPDLAEKALRAGFSGNNPYDRLGLFGMGFNISTGKLGSVTRFFTRRIGEEATEVVVDLQRMQDRKTYQVPFSRVDTHPELAHGTFVEVRGMWPEGNSNRRFLKTLVAYGRPKIAFEIGRRYATILREDKVRILINNHACVPFEHCVWDKSRFVERQGLGQIPAQFHFNEQVGSQTRCLGCAAAIGPASAKCPECGSSSFRTIEERVRGWVGISRFDHQQNFGVDLIRNGRAIRVFEQEAFFTFTDEFKKTIKDYPIDSQYGRIVGEVHLNHVPVDFLKQDFQRSTEEWQRAITFLRGESSLQPTQPNTENNHSPIYKLYQGYRRVRVPGTHDMYMGVWDKEKKKPVRFSNRDTEQEYYNKFLEREPGYYDDAEWWKLVESADRAPLPELSQCPHCPAENLATAEECQACGAVLIGKACLKCAHEILLSAVSCPHCGQSQLPEFKEPWKCKVCGSNNKPGVETCSTCSRTRGTSSPISADHLREASDRDDDLSLLGLSVPLANGSHSQPVNVYVYLTRTPIVPWQGRPVPLIAFKADKFEIFVDKSHPVFNAFQLKPEFMIASEVADYIYELNRSQITSGAVHTLSNLTWEVLERRWSDTLEDSADKVSDAIDGFLDMLRERLRIVVGDRAEDFYGDLTEEEQRSLVETLINRGQDPARLAEMRTTGEFFKYIDGDTLVSIFKKEPGLFFDGHFWSKSFNKGLDLPDAIVREYQHRVRAPYLNSLEDVAAFIQYETPDLLLIQRARASVDFLLRNVT